MTAAQKELGRIMTPKSGARRHPVIQNCRRRRLTLTLTLMPIANTWSCDGKVY